MPYDLECPLIRAPQKTITFTGGAGLGQSGSPVPIYTVTGRLWILSMYAYCSSSLGGATATFALGTTNNTTAFGSAVTATDLLADSWLITGAVVSTGVGGTVFAAGAYALDGYTGNENIIGTVGTANITSGTMVFDMFYYPLTTDASVV